MGALIANLGRIQGNTDIHLLLTHHQPAEKERMRGHGALLGAVDTTIHVTKIGNRPAGRGGQESSDHEEGQRIAFSLKSVTIGQDEHGDPITAPVVVEAVAGVAPKKKAELPAAAKVAINALQEAIDDLGVIPPASSHIPPMTKAVTMEQWRDYAYRLGISGSEEPRARQQAVRSRHENASGGQGHRYLGASRMDRIGEQSEQSEHFGTGHAGDHKANTPL